MHPHTALRTRSISHQQSQPSHTIARSRERRQASQLASTAHPPLQPHSQPRHLRYGTVGLRAGYVRQDSRPLSFLPVKAQRYARLEGTRLSLAKGPNGEIIWSFDIAGSLVESNTDDRKIFIFMLDSQRRKRRVMVLSIADEKSFIHWSYWLSRASHSVLEMHYSMDRLISKGAFARVVLGKDLHTGEPVAIKLIEKSNAPPSERKYFEREVKIMHALSHPNIVKCYDIFDTRLRTRIVMEYVEGGTLADLIANHEMPLPEALAKSIMRDILSGVKYLHKMGTIHRDLKPDNCLFSSNSHKPYGTVKLSDFGLSNYVAMASHSADSLCDDERILTSAVGSPGFVAPEIYESGYGSAVDIWSCGVILYMMLSGGSMPFAGKNKSEVIIRARHGMIDYSSPALRATSDAAKKFVRALLTFDDRQRITAEQALRNPWLVDGD